jgi:hypothetical protein
MKKTLLFNIQIHISEMASLIFKKIDSVLKQKCIGTNTMSMQIN